MAIQISPPAPSIPVIIYWSFRKTQLKLSPVSRFMNTRVACLPSPPSMLVSRVCLGINVFDVNIEREGMENFAIVSVLTGNAIQVIICWNTSGKHILKTYKTWSFHECTYCYPPAFFNVGFTRLLGHKRLRRQHWKEREGTRSKRFNSFHPPFFFLPLFFMALSSIHCKMLSTDTHDTHLILGACIIYLSI